jgi:hypothetical protein
MTEFRLIRSSISSALDETIAQLDAIHRAERERKATTFEALRAIVAGLDVVTPGVDDEPAVTAGGGLGRPTPARHGPDPVSRVNAEPALIVDRELRGRLLSEATSTSRW